MILTTTQHTLLRELYFKTINEKGIPKYYVWTKNTDSRTVYALFKLGFISSSHIRNNLPTNMQLTQEGYNYGWEHFRDIEEQGRDKRINGIYIEGTREYKKDIRRKLYRRV